jgi:surfeit locus 1 family protein
MVRSLIVPVLVIAVAIAALCGLGTWQLQRHTWKSALLEQLAARSKADPVSLAAALQKWTADRDVAYLRVRVVGRYDHTREAHLYSTGPTTWGWQVLTPLKQADGSTLLVNRGFVPDALKDPAKRADGLPSGEVTVTGLLAVPAAIQPAFAPDNEPARNRWYWLDASQLLQPPLPPYVLQAEPVPGAAAPNGGATVRDLPNNHLGYALTWYGLAVTLAVMGGLFLRGRWQSSRRTPESV